MRKKKNDNWVNEFKNSIKNQILTYEKRKNGD